MLQGMTAHYLATSTYPSEEGRHLPRPRGRGGSRPPPVPHREESRRARDRDRFDRGEGGEGAGGRGGRGDPLYPERFRRRDEAPHGRARASRPSTTRSGRRRSRRGSTSSRRAARWRSSGSRAAPRGPIDPQILNQKGSIFLTRPTLFHYVASREELLARAGDVLAWVKDGSLPLRIDRTFPLAEAAAAHRALEARETSGKVLLLPG